MKPKQLTQMLSMVDSFSKPKAKLEQYPTSPEIATQVLLEVDSFDDICGKVVLDLGCGGGILGIGALCLGAGHAIGVDIDEDVLEIARSNCEEMEIPMDFIQSDISSWVDTCPIGQKVDTVIMNPPFGTKKEGVDMLFLKAASQVAITAIYSFHKTSTRRFILKTAAEMGLDAKVIGEVRFDIPNMYKFHKQKSVDVAVDIVRFARRDTT
mmetsp:Transcript_51552/g.129326  ORF Transcript_51552/g.129326 Transcript_51552/m.129326 type:complete len:210 (-) Transcript_51552:257-886(-)